MRLALNLGLDLPKREAQTLLPLVVETLEQHALADASVGRSRWRGDKTLGDCWMRCSFFFGIF